MCVCAMNYYGVVSVCMCGYIIVITKCVDVMRVSDV